MEQPIGPTDSATAVATPPQAEPTVANSTANTPSTSDAGSTEKTAPVEDSFTNIDPKDLPPELKSKYDSMLSDYKKKTADIAQFKRDYDASQDKIRLAEIAASDPDIVNLLNQKYGQKNETSQPYNAETVDPVQAYKQKVDVLEANLVIKDFKAAHQDFDQLDSDGLITGFVRLNPPKDNSEGSYKETLKKAYEYASSLKTKWKEEGRKEGLSRIQEKASQSTNAPSPNSPNTYSGDPKKMSVSEAVELARKGIRIQP